MPFWRGCLFSQIPNILTLLRLLAAPFLVVLLREGAYLEALILFVLAGISDGLDGYIAKRFDLVSRLGAILDPLADKVLIISTYVMLTILGDLPFWVLIVVGFRDLVIIGGYLILDQLYQTVQMSPSRISKLNTFTQIFLVIVVLLQQASGWVGDITVNLGIACVVITTIASGIHYVWVWGIRTPAEHNVE